MDLGLRRALLIATIRNILGWVRSAETKTRKLRDFRGQGSRTFFTGDSSLQTDWDKTQDQSTLSSFSSRNKRKSTSIIINYAIIKMNDIIKN